jgi:PAS domain S-box-containing protein
MPPLHSALRDPARLAALRRTTLLSASPDEAFDRLTRLATMTLGAPVALVTLVDAERQLLKGCIGLPEPWASARETGLTHSVCQHVVASNEPLIITDAREHPLVRDSLAIPDLGVVAYAGIPLLTSDGYALGSFCVIDHEPRVWTTRELTILRDLAASVMTEIELRATDVERTRLLAETRHARAAADRARAAMERQQAHLRDIFARAPALIALVVGPRHLFEFVNPTYARMVGRTDAELIGRPAREATPTVAGRDVDDILDEVTRTGAPYRATEAPLGLNRRDDGVREESSVTLVYQPLRDADGHVAGILCHGVEVTAEVRARRRVEELAREQAAARARLQQVVDVLPEGIVVIDASGRVVLANHMAADLLGPDIVGRSMARVEREAAALSDIRRLDGTPYPAEDLPLERSVGRGEEVRGVQLLLRHAADGHDIPALLNSAPLRDAAGAITGAVLVFQDITTIKNVERARDELLATVTHDLKNPLTAIQGIAELTREQAARTGTPRNARIAARQGAIVTAATQMTALLNELLDAMQLQMGQPLALSLHPTDLVGLVRRVIDYQRAIAARPMRVEADGPAVVCDVDAERIERMIGNLASNAIKYSPKGEGVVVHLTRDQGVYGAWAVLTVADRGVGIPAKDLPHVFDRFYRAENTGNVEGTGIGLASVREVVAQHGGTVAIASREGVGTTVTVRLPVAGSPAS